MIEDAGVCGGGSGRLRAQGFSDLKHTLSHYYTILLGIVKESVFLIPDSCIINVIFGILLYNFFSEGIRNHNSG
jgi:hypothetical protein